MVTVTKTFLPPINDYFKQIEKSFKNGWLTNRGELVLELESKIADFLDFKETKVLCVNNGTIPIQIALKLLGNGGEIITTPFSYVATTSAIIWENCTPVFVDIHPEYLTIDESKIELSITEKTTCILATHVYGNPCNVEEIERIADKYNLKVIYDAAHCFGVSYKGKSIFEYGDVSTCSFHATKVFHTAEGGAIFCKDKELMQNFFYSHNFGHKNETEFWGVGINAKMSELSAAMGLANLPHLTFINSQRKFITDFYDNNLNFNTFSKIKIRKDTKWNYSYYPIFFKSNDLLKTILSELNENDIFPRRYFNPSLNCLKYVHYVEAKNSEKISDSIICLPLYVGIDLEILKKICFIINSYI